jgi:Xaa-Pro aminopeptidase
MSTVQLAAIRTEMRRRELAAVLVPRADEHLGEYVPANAERLAWLSGFTGSAGLAIVLAERACLFTDGRYVTQAAAQLDPAAWERRHLTDDPPAVWLASVLPPEAAVGYDPMLFSQETLTRFVDAGCRMVATDGNIVDAVWTDRPAPPMAPAFIQPLELAGVDSAEKRAQIARLLREARQDAVVLTDPASIAWLLNLRGRDVPFTPFLLGFAVARADETVDLFVAPEKLPPDMHAWLGNAVRPRTRAELAPALGEWAGRRVRVDPAGAPVWFAQRLRDAGATVVEAADPCLLPKATKNPVEIDGARRAHARDAVAVCRFLHWLDTDTAPASEWTAAERLLGFRRELEDFRGESFPAISGAGENGAIIHYRVDPATARPLRANEPYLIDSGAQFGCGTTDITRTVWRGPEPAPAELRDRATRVLRGHIAIASLRFPRGTTGAPIDAFARRALWDVGLDYDHGTGHGVGSFLSVHEGPVGLSRLARPIALAPGMILSNEPGFYAPGQYGIRLENLLLVEPTDPALVPFAAGRAFLSFETLTLAPFDRRLIDPRGLGPAEREWVDDYHARVLREVGPALDGPVRSWLEAVCSPLGVV